MSGATCLYTDTLNRFWKYPRTLDRTSFLCELTCVEEGGRVNPGTEKLVINNKSLTLILITFVKREDKPDFDVKTKHTRFLTLFLKFHGYFK